MHDSVAGRILWTVAYLGLGVFWTVVALQQFGNAWTIALDGVDPTGGPDDVRVG